VEHAKKIEHMKVVVLVKKSQHHPYPLEGKCLEKVPFVHV
jgi:hypothetical protein